MKKVLLVYVGRRLSSDGKLRQEFLDSMGKKHHWNQVKAQIGCAYHAQVSGRGAKKNWQFKKWPDMVLDSSKQDPKVLHSWDVADFTAVTQHKELCAKKRAVAREPAFLKALEPLASVMKDLSMREAEALIKGVTLKFWMKNGGKRL